MRLPSAVAVPAKRSFYREGVPATPIPAAASRARVVARSAGSPMCVGSQYTGVSADFACHPPPSSRRFRARRGLIETASSRFGLQPSISRLFVSVSSMNSVRVPYPPSGRQPSALIVGGRADLELPGGPLAPSGKRLEAQPLVKKRGSSAETRPSSAATSEELDRRAMLSTVVSARGPSAPD